ncbi:(R)-mandelonitrile lyase [Rufibacter latericius]|uniref:Cupin domain-containing protein n=1 Tax=Rufibacter latericius TaxID=2487040 RepID=A0A3M9MEQ2_9BACT|nr:cupin domain-containing protein [Rufibacter latericius]RNI24046.1 cupin domain-containing protein [Rufibacter latericius]
MKNLVVKLAAIVSVFGLSSCAVAQNVKESAQAPGLLYAKGVRAPSTNFTGTVWVNMLVTPEDRLDSGIGSVTFEPGARSNWHMHPGGQVLLVTEGKGLYQERGKQVQVMQKGDVMKCPPGVEHWHGASPDAPLTHIAISVNAEKGGAKWGEPVTDEQYNSFK